MGTSEPFPLRGSFPAVEEVLCGLVGDLRAALGDCATVMAFTVAGSLCHNCSAETRPTTRQPGFLNVPSRHPQRPDHRLSLADAIQLRQADNDRICSFCSVSLLLSRGRTAWLGLLDEDWLTRIGWRGLLDEDWLTDRCGLTVSGWVGLRRGRERERCWAVYVSG